MCDQSRHSSGLDLIPPPHPTPTPIHSQPAAACDPPCPSWTTITLGLPILCYTPLTLRPVFGLTTPRPFRRLARRAPRLGRRPPNPKDECAPVSPADAVGVPRSNASTTAWEPLVGRASMEGRTASILRLRLLDRDVAKVASLADRTNRQTKTGGRNRARVYKPTTMERPLDWALLKALVPCSMRSILVC